MSTTSAHTWDLVCAALRPERHCLALDQRGHGENEWSPEMDYATESHAGDLDAFVHALKLERFVLVGMSLGGVNALAWAGTHGRRLAGLVLVDVGPEIRFDGVRKIAAFTSDAMPLDSVEQFVDRGRTWDMPGRPTCCRCPDAAATIAARCGDVDGALARHRDALAAARRLYGDDHPNVGFAHAALGVWHARFGDVVEARHHLRVSRQVDDARGGLYVNIAETRLPASGSDPGARAVVRLRLQRDLLLCALEGGCSPARVLGLGEALGEARP